jgi:uncharacterized membrane protein YdbT with pleckstrin-like domain
MAGSYLEKTLGNQEAIRFTTRQHWLVLIRSILLEILLILILTAGVTAILMLTSFPDQTAFGYLLILLPLVSLVYKVLRWRNHEYVITNQRVIQITGILNKTVLDSSLEKVNDIKMEQSTLGRLFSYGNIEILTASELGIDHLTFIQNPIRFKTSLANAREDLVHEPAGEFVREDIPNIIANLENLREKGILSQEEFESKKKELLSKI